MVSEVHPADNGTFPDGRLTVLCSHAFWDTDSLRRTMQIVECMQFITLVGPGQNFLLAKEPDQLLWKHYIP